MKINKITPGFVIQSYDTDTGRCIGQEFVAGDHVQYEDDIGLPVEWREAAEACQPFSMVQPGRGSYFNLFVIGGTDALVLGPYASDEERVQGAKDTWQVANHAQDNLFKFDVDETGMPNAAVYVDELESE